MHIERSNRSLRQLDILFFLGIAAELCIQHPDLGLEGYRPYLKCSTVYINQVGLAETVATLLRASVSFPLRSEIVPEMQPLEILVGMIYLDVTRKRNNNRIRTRRDINMCKLLMYLHYQCLVNLLEVRHNF